ncbi:hypothetical protein DQ04_05771050 [Trypanosoma grayi]|uniref:hypothetical protein n=1 Tax=Trypanosoma grayi TaxID=71804 RepID=UPI0004F4B7FE|nr:hypothetical protein DQ04_05771050 [Trypanosoma grayi]KEG09122.1 hypothetical protein DQ04_05771050 [Trypanosoma grayi]
MLLRELPLAAFVCPTCGHKRHNKREPTRHRMGRHGFRPKTAKQSQNGQCEETGLHLQSFPALKSPRCNFGVDMATGQSYTSRELMPSIFLQWKGFALNDPHRRKWRPPQGMGGGPFPHLNFGSL